MGGFQVTLDSSISLQKMASVFSVTILKNSKDVLARNFLSFNFLYKGAKTRVTLDFKFSGQLEHKVGMDQISASPPLLLAAVVDIVSELVKGDLLSELLLLADDLVLINETIEHLKNKLRKRKDGFESKGLKINDRKPKRWLAKGLPRMVCLKLPAKILPEHLHYTYTSYIYIIGYYIIYNHHCLSL